MLVGNQTNIINAKNTFEVSDRYTFASKNGLKQTINFDIVSK